MGFLLAAHFIPSRFVDRLLSINADVLALEQAGMQNLDESFEH